MVPDAFSRRIVGSSMASYLRTDLVVAALELASPSAGRGASPTTPI